MLLEASSRNILCCHDLLSISVPGIGKGVYYTYAHISMAPLAKLFLSFSSDPLPEHTEKPQDCPGGAVGLGNQSQGLGFADVSLAEKS